jgi:phosphoenolpyruvate-protein kinase (PTS system EI component)
MNLTPEEIAILEAAYEILAAHRLNADFNQKHDFMIPDVLQAIDEVIDFSISTAKV